MSTRAGLLTSPVMIPGSERILQPRWIWRIGRALASWRDHLLSGLRKARVNLVACRFLIGICGDSTDNLAPSGIARLIRYVRLNLPEAMKVVAGRLSKLLIASNDHVTKARQSERAA